MTVYRVFMFCADLHVLVSSKEFRHPSLHIQ